MQTGQSNFVSLERAHALALRRSSGWNCQIDLYKAPPTM